MRNNHEFYRWYKRKRSQGVRYTSQNQAMIHYLDERAVLIKRRVKHLAFSVNTKTEDASIDIKDGIRDQVSRIKDTIANGLFKQAFTLADKVLMEEIFPNLRNDFILLKAQFSYEWNQISLGLKKDDFTINRIINSLLQLVVKLESNFLNEDFNKDKIDNNYEIVIKIEKDLMDYSIEEQQEFLEIIQNILEIQGRISIKRINIGSIYVVIGLNGEANVKKLMIHIKSGGLEKLGIFDASISKSPSVFDDKEFKQQLLIEELLEIAILIENGNVKSARKLLNALIFHNSLKKIIDEIESNQLLWIIKTILNEVGKVTETIPLV